MNEQEKDERKAIGGLARAKKLSPAERSAIAKKAAEKRWDLPKATHEGSLQLGNVKVDCAVLKDGRRVITQSDFMIALGRARQAKGRRHYNSDVNMPAFLTANNLKPFISEELKVTSSQIEFRTLRGGKAFGYPAELLPKVCDVFLDAEDAKALVEGQKHIALRAKLLMRGLAHVGIIALVDEATGYQYDRARTALAEILETFITNELRKWIKTFPDEFYKQIARLKGYQLKDINKRGQVYATLTNYLIYKRLAPGVLKELKKITPKDTKGRRKHKYFQRLTEDVGHPALRELLSNQIVLMKIFEDGDWKGFDKKMNKIIPPYGNHPLFEIAAETSTSTIASVPLS